MQLNDDMYVMIPRGEREGSSRRFMLGSLARISLKYWLTEEITSLWTSNDFVLQASSRSVRNLGGVFAKFHHQQFRTNNVLLAATL